MINQRLKNKILRIVDENCRKKAEKYFDSYYSNFTINESYNNLVHIDNFIRKFKNVPNNSELMEALKQTKYLTQISEMGIHKSLQTLQTLTETFKTDIKYKVNVENMLKDYHSANKFEMFKYLVEWLSNPYYQENDVVKRLRENMIDFYRLNEESILLYNALQYTGKTQFDNFAREQLTEEILNYITEGKIKRADLQETLKQFPGSSLASQCYLILDKFGKEKMRFGENGNVKALNVYSFTNEVDKNTFIFGTRNKLYEANIGNETFEEIQSELAYQENAAILQMNNLVEQYFDSNTESFKFIVVGKLLEMKYVPEIKKNVIKYGDSLVTENFGEFLNKMLHLNKIPEHEIVWKIYENLNLYKPIEFVTLIESKDRSRNAFIFNFNDNFGVELNDNIKQFGQYKGKLNATSLKNFVFEHLNCDISDSLNRFLTKERSIIKTIENQRAIVSEEIQPLKTSIEKIEKELKENRIAHEYKDQTLKLKEDLEERLEEKQRHLNSLNQKILEFESQTGEVELEIEDTIPNLPVAGDKINYNGNLMIVSIVDTVAEKIICTDVDGKQVYISFDNIGNFENLTQETEEGIVDVHESLKHRDNWFYVGNDECQVTWDIDYDTDEIYAQEFDFKNKVFREYILPIEAEMDLREYSGYKVQINIITRDHWEGIIYRYKGILNDEMKGSQWNDKKMNQLFEGINERIEKVPGNVYYTLTGSPKDDGFKTKEDFRKTLPDNWIEIDIKQADVLFAGGLSIRKGSNKLSVARRNGIEIRSYADGAGELITNCGNNCKDYAKKEYKKKESDEEINESFIQRSNIVSVELNDVLKNKVTGEKYLVTGISDVEKIIVATKTTDNFKESDKDQSRLKIKFEDYEDEWENDVAVVGPKKTVYSKTDPLNITRQDAIDSGDIEQVSEGMLAQGKGMSQSIFPFEYQGKLYTVILEWKGKAEYKNIIELKVYYDDKEVTDANIIDEVYYQLRVDDQLWEGPVNENTNIIFTGFTRIDYNKKGDVNVNIKPSKKIGYSDILVNENKYSIPNNRVIKFIKESFGENIRLGKEFDFNFDCYDKSKKIELFENLDIYRINEDDIDIDLSLVTEPTIDAISTYHVNVLSELKDVLRKLNIEIESETETSVFVKLPTQTTGGASVNLKEIKVGDTLTIDWINNKIVGINDEVILEIYGKKFGNNLVRIIEAGLEDAPEVKLDDPEEIMTQNNDNENIEEIEPEENQIDIPLNARVLIIGTQEKGSVTFVDTNSDNIQIQTDSGHIVELPINSENKEWERIDEFGNAYEKGNNLSMAEEITKRFLKLNNIPESLELKVVENIPDKLSNYLFINFDLVPVKMMAAGFLDVKSDMITYEDKMFSVCKTSIDDKTYIIILRDSKFIALYEMIYVIEKSKK